MSRLTLLSEILQRAAGEGALEGDNLAALARALEERSRIILREWWKRTQASLGQQVTSLESEIAWRKQTQADLEQRVSSLEDSLERANEAHDRLLAHHREVLRRVERELTGMGALGFMRVRELRRRVLALEKTLQGDGS